MAESRSGETRSRRSHPKSRLGCKTCKARKIKCDESRPSCQNCRKHQVKCDFAASLPSTPSSRQSLDDHSLNAPDLELLHIYVTATVPTITEVLTMRDFFRHGVVQLGLQPGSEYLMHNLLAVSALHLASQRPDHADHYVSLGMKHQQIASSLVVPLLSTIQDADSAEALFVFSILTTIYALGSPRRDNDFIVFGGETGFPDWLFLLRGSNTVLPYIALGRRHTGFSAPLFDYGREVWLARSTTEEDPNLPLTQPLRDLQDYFQNSKGSCASTNVDVDDNENNDDAEQEEEDDEELREICVHAVEELRKSYAILHAKGPSWDQSACFVWMFHVANDLTPLLNASPPKQQVLVVLSYFCALLLKIDNRWFIRGWPDHLMRKIVSLLHARYRGWVRFPAEEMGIVI